MILSVKYDQAHLLCEPWWRIGQLPKLFSLIRERRWRIIDIHRKDPVGLCISNQIAIKTRIYHVSSAKSDKGEIARIHIDPAQLAREVEATRKVYSSVAEHFSEHPEYRMIYYEDMFEEGAKTFSTQLIEDMCSFLGLENRFDDKPKLQKLLSGDALSHVENASEIRDAMAMKSLTS